MTRRLWSLLLIVGLTWLWAAPPGHAHAVLMDSYPATNAILEEAPDHIWLAFSEAIIPNFSAITLYDQAGRALETGVLQQPAGQHIAQVTLPPLADGVYLVNWQALSAVDGHTTNGSFAFGVSVEQLTAVSSATVVPPLSLLGLVSRWLNLVGLTLLLGVCTFRILVWNPLMTAGDIEADERALDKQLGQQQVRLLAIGAALIFAGLITLFIRQSQTLNLLDPANLLIWLESQFGTMWAVRLALVIAFAWGAYHLGQIAVKNNDNLPTSFWWVGAAVAAGMALTTALVSHSAALLDYWLAAVATDFIHLLAAAIWAGGLLQLFLALRQVRRLPTEARAWFNYSLIFQFSALAAMAAGLLLLSGSYLAWLHVGSWQGLFGTAYGRTLLFKSALIVPVLGLAAVNLLILKPRLDAAVDAPETEISRAWRGRFRRIVTAEGTLLLAVLLAAGLLTDLQRAQDAPLVSGQGSEINLSYLADDLAIDLTIAPALVGQNAFAVQLTDQQGEPVEDASQVTLRFSYLGEALGLSEATAVHRGDGRYQVEASNITLIGGWQIEVAVRRPGAFDSFAPFRLEADVNGQIRPFGQASWLDRLSLNLTRTGNLIPALLLVVVGIAWFVLAPRAVTRNWQLAPLLAMGLIALWVGGQQLIEFYQDFTPTRFLSNPILPDAGSIAQGADLYDRYCELCHGPQGLGDGPAAAGLVPPPADFTIGHTDTHPDGDLYYWIQNGLSDGAMPAFGDQLTDEEVWHLVNYVRRLSAAR